MKAVIRKLSGLFLLAVLLVGAMTVSASAADAFVTDGVHYKILDDSSVQVTGSDSGVQKVTIPAKVHGYRVTEIASGAFQNNTSLQTLTFESGCQIETIRKAFNGCENLTTIQWGHNTAVTEITESFAGCTALETLTIPASVQTIGKAAFSNCTSLCSLEFAEGSQLRTIGKEAFAYTGKAEDLVPATIASLTLPASLETLEEGAFHCIPVAQFALEDQSSLTEIPDGFLSADGADGRPGEKTECSSIWDYVINWFRSLTEPYPATPAKVAEACDCLVRIDLGDHNALTRIGMGAFKNQTHLTSIDFGTDAVSTGLVIARGAFVAVGNNGVTGGTSDGIETLVLPANLVELGSRSFDYARIQNLVFSDGCQLSEIPDGFLENGEVGSNGKPGKNSSGNFENNPVQIAANSLRTISFGKNNSLTSIGSGAFKNQGHITDIDFGTSTADALTICEGAFIGAGNNGYLVDQNVEETLNAGIETLVLPANLTVLGAGSFEAAKIINLKFSDDCKLQTIPDGFLGIQEAGNNGYPCMEMNWSTRTASFSNDQAQLQAISLKTVSFGGNNSLTTIGSGAFRNQSHMTAIDFGTSTTAELSIRAGAFVGVGNNGYLVEQGADETPNPGIDTLVFPANLVDLESDFQFANISNLAFSDNCQLHDIPANFLGVLGYGCNGKPGLKYTDYAGTKVSFVEDQAQLQANSLKTISLGKNNSLSYIGSAAFRNQGHITSIDFGTSTSESIGIGACAFVGAGNNGYLVDQGVEDTLSAGIETLVFPANLTSLSADSFSYANIRNLVFSDHCKLGSIPEDFMGIIGTGCNGKPGDQNGTFVKDHAQLLANSLQTVTFGEDNSLTRINNAAFRNQSHLTVIDFGTPKNQLTIGSAAFTGAGNNSYLVSQGVDETLNTGIETLVFPANLKSIDNGAFEFARVCRLVFSDGSQLRSIPDGFLAVGGPDGQPSTEDVRVGANSLVSVSFGEGNHLINIWNGAFQNQSHLTEISFGTNADGGKLTLRAGTFAGTAPETLTLPANLAFDDAGQFKKAKVKHLVFADNFQLTTLPEGFLTKDYNDPEDAPVLESIDFGENNSLTTIGAGMFAGNGQLKSLDLSGTNITTIEKGAFNDCGMTSLILPETLTTLNNGAFQGLTGLKKLTIGSDCPLTTLEGGVFSKCSELTTVDLRNSNITTIGDSLKENEKLTTVILPAGLQAISWDASDETICPFYGCDSLTKLRFTATDPGSLTISPNALQNLAASGIVYVPADTSDAQIEAYQALLTTGGLTFGDDAWNIRRVVPVTSITLSEETAYLLVGDTTTLTATVAPEDATDAEVVWSSSDPTVATVDDGGSITAVGAGTAVITATAVDGGLTAACTVSVSNPPVEVVTYAVTVRTGEGGTASASYESCRYGVPVTVTVTPDAGYELASIFFTDPVGQGVAATDNGDGTYTFNMPAGDVTVSIAFRKTGSDDSGSTDYQSCTKDASCVYAKYTDADPGAWYHDGVHYCVRNGLMNGTSATTFAPNENLSRAMIVTILWRNEGSPVVDYAMSFTDVAADTWYTEAVRWAQANGIVTGYTDTAFGPNNPVTREQLAAILYRYAAYRGADTAAAADLSGYTDAGDISAWATEGVCWANAVGILNGRTATTLVPGGNATRAEAASMLQRFCETVLQDE